MTPGDLVAHPCAKALRPRGLRLVGRIGRAALILVAAFLVLLAFLVGFLGRFTIHLIA